MMLFPLCWPIVVVCAPCFCDMLWSMFVSDARKMRHQYLILTPTHLKVITKIENGGEACCSNRGSCTPESHLQSIALADIASCGIRESRVDLIVPPCCISPSPEIYVNVTVPGSNGTEGRRRTKTAATAIGMLECQSFVQEVVKQRDLVRRLNNSETLLTVATMDRGDVETTVSTTVEDRIRQIVDLRDQGVLSLAQFEHERQATVDSM
jgi:hypothetical protein